MSKQTMGLRGGNTTVKTYGRHRQRVVSDVWNKATKPDANKSDKNVFSVSSSQDSLSLNSTNENSTSSLFHPRCKQRQQTSSR